MDTRSDYPHANWRADWFGLTGRRSLPARGPRWFVTRCANCLYISLGGICAVTVPWFWSRAAIEARGYDRGFLAGYEAGYSYGKQEGRSAS